MKKTMWTNMCNKRFLVLVGSVCIASLAVPVLFLLFAASFGTVNHGVLLQPPLAMTEQPELLPLQTRIQAQVPKGVWQFAVMTGAFCDTTCRAQLEAVKTAHILLNEQSRRFHRIALVPQTLQQSVDDEVTTVVLPEVSQQFLQSLFHKHDIDPVGAVMIIDPLGHIVLLYSHRHGIKAILFDAKRLLKASRIG